MAARVNLKGFDDLLENTLQKVDHRFPTPFPKRTEQKQKFGNAVLEKLLEDYFYRVDECYGSESHFKLKVTTGNFPTNDFKGWLAEFQASTT